MRVPRARHAVYSSRERRVSSRVPISTYIRRTSQWPVIWIKLEAAFQAVEKDLSSRVAKLAAKSTTGTLSQEEQA
jgi:hypothetical protein